MVPQPQKLGPVKKALRVTGKSQKGYTPCLNAMSTVLACWASSGFNTAGCAAVEQSLRLCMVNDIKPPQKSTEINIHLARFQKRVLGKIKSNGTKA